GGPGPGRDAGRWLAPAPGSCRAGRRGRGRRGGPTAPTLLAPMRATAYATHLRARPVSRPLGCLGRVGWVGRDSGPGGRDWGLARRGAGMCRRSPRQDAESLLGGPGDGRLQAGVVLEEPPEIGDVEREELTLAQRRDGGGAHRVANQGDLAE